MTFRRLLVQNIQKYTAIVPGIAIKEERVGHRQSSHCSTGSNGRQLCTVNNTSLGLNDIEVLECRTRILIMPNKHPVNLLGGVVVDASQAGGVDRRDVIIDFQNKRLWNFVRACFRNVDGAVNERSLGQSVNVAL